MLAAANGRRLCWSLDRKEWEDFLLERRFNARRPAFEQGSEQYFMREEQGKHAVNFIRQIGQDLNFPLSTGQTR